MKFQKRQKKPEPSSAAVIGPALYVVATPLGNLNDVTTRIVDVLSHVSAVLCEDTRVTAKLLGAKGISKSLLRLEESPSKVDAFLDRILSGESLAMVSDAGTPGINDPGAVLVRRAHHRGVKVVPIPGPSALTTFISAAGLSAEAFSYVGYLPRSESEIHALLEKFLDQELGDALVFLESPLRIRKSLETFAAWADRIPMGVCILGKELTKIHERIVRTKLTDLPELLKSEEFAWEKGEWIGALERGKPLRKEKSPVIQEASKMALFCLLSEGVRVKDAVNRVGQVFGENKKELYRLAIEKINSEK